MRRIRVVGIDPGSLSCGFGVIEQDDLGNLRHICSGTITLPRREPLRMRLRLLYEEVRGIMKRYGPEEAAIETVFFAKGVNSALHLGYARGVILLATAEEGIDLYEYSPGEVKKAVVGYGRAEKGQMQWMVRTILSLEETPLPDSADALALAICHLNTVRGTGRALRGSS